MRFRQFVLPVAILALSLLALYLLLARHLLQDPEISPATATPAHSRNDESVGGPPNSAYRNASASSTAAVQRVAGGRKLVEIFGRVLDPEGRPIADALIAEEKYFASTRSLADGRYRLLLNLPVHRFPSLHFLRNGYTGRLVRLGKDDFQQGQMRELDVVLESADDTVDLQGWVGDEIGQGIEGARVEIIATQRANRDSYYLTAFSDAAGEFEFEGVRADDTYKLTINPATEYPYYENPAFRVSRNPPRIEVRLARLHFVDIDGMIVGSDGQPVPNYEMYISNLTIGGHSRKLVSDSSGYFSLRNFPVGEISLSTRGQEFYKVSGLQISESSFQNLSIQVDRGSHYLSGWVSDANGLAIEKAMVTLDHSRQDGSIEYSSYRSQATDRNGSFEFTDLGSVEYRLSVYALGYRKQDLKFHFDAPARNIRITLQHY